MGHAPFLDPVATIVILNIWVQFLRVMLFSALMWIKKSENDDYPAWRMFSRP
jgi:hypothetical protein